MPYIENFAEFDSRQKSPSYQDLHHNSVVYENGAVFRLGSLAGDDPPTDEFELTRRQMAYQALHVQVLEQALDTFRRACAQQAMHVAKGYLVPPPPEDAIETMKREGLRIVDERAKLNAMAIKLQSAPEAIQADAMAEKRTARMTAAHAFIQQLNELNV